MSSITTFSLVIAFLAVAVLIGRQLRRLLPKHHLDADTRDVIKLSMGLVATMTALVLGLLVSSAKGAYDTSRAEVMQLAAKVTTLDRALSIYGPDAAPIRVHLQHAMQNNIADMWPDTGKPTVAIVNPQAGDEAFAELQQLAPADDAHRNLKTSALALATDVAQLRALLAAQAVPSVSTPMVAIVVAWLAIIFLSFSVLAPPNATAGLTLLISALSVSGAIFLILELDRPFGGFLQVSSQPMLNALSQMSRGNP